MGGQRGYSRCCWAGWDRVHSPQLGRPPLNGLPGSGEISMLEANGCAFPASAEKRLEEPGSSRLCRSSRTPRAGGGPEVDRAPSGGSAVPAVVGSGVHAVDTPPPPCGHSRAPPAGLGWGGEVHLPAGPGWPQAAHPPSLWAAPSLTELRFIGSLRAVRFPANKAN